MLGLLRSVLSETAKLTGTVLGIATAPIAIALNVSESLVKDAIEAGCKTQEEIKEWIDDNT